MMHPQRLLFRLGPTLLLFFISLAGIAQDTLPSFSAEIKSKNRIIISWTNPYGNNIKQLSIQRSRDSSRLFKTIISIPDPTVLQNGFVDQNLPDTNFYYRVYIMLDGGDYVFSPVRKARSIPPPPKHIPVTRKPEPPAKQEPIKTEPLQKPKPVEPEKPKLPVPQPEEYLVIKKGDEIVGELNERYLQRFRDSVSMRTKDTILLSNRDTLFIKPFQPKEVYSVSKYVFIDKAGLVHIELPWYARRKYLVKFFEEDRSPLFEIKDVKDAVLLLDKANFMQAGWYLFEIYEDGKLLEKNKLFVGKDF